MRDRLRRVTDLFVQGTEVLLPDSTYLWLQALNPFERDECISDAQVARSRLVMAMKAAGNERVKIEARLLEHGRDRMITDLAEVKADSRATDLANEIQDDPDWKERMEIIRRTDFEQSAKPPTEEEVELIKKINDDYINELTERITAERVWQVTSLDRLNDVELVDEYVDVWLERRAAAVGTAEYELTEAWFTTRLCDGELIDGQVDHSKCGTHADRLFEDKADVRSAPEPLTQMLRTALLNMSMGPRDPKGSASPVKSSDSSQLPSEPEASIPSTSTETRD